MTTLLTLAAILWLVLIVILYEVKEDESILFIVFYALFVEIVLILCTMAVLTLAASMWWMFYGMFYYL